MSISPGTRWLLILLVSVGVTVAALFWWVQWQSTSIDSFYAVTDSLMDPSGKVVAAVYFVRVDAYDTTKMQRVGMRLAEEAHKDQVFTKERERSLLLYFFEPSDTAQLSDVMVDELSYTNPEVSDPRNKLHVVRNGFVMHLTFDASKSEPNAEAHVLQRLFYMPRPGVRAADIR